MALPDISTSCNQYVRDGNENTLLEVVKQHIVAGNVELFAVLASEQYKDILVTLGWELLTVITSLSLPLDTAVLRFINIIVEVGSPKELTLGLLELLETCRSIWECMKLLEATQKAFLRLTSANALGSSLYSTSKIIHHRYHLLTVLPGYSASDVLLGSHGDHQSNAATACPEVEECDDDGTCSYDNVVTILEQLVQFVHPFVSQIHHGRGSMDHMIPLTSIQHGCISLLLTMLGPPLIDCDIHHSSQLLSNVQAVMQCISHTHCGCLRLLEWPDQFPQQSLRQEGILLSTDGIAGYAHMILVEGIQRDYLPSVVSAHHLLNVSVRHIMTLLSRPSEVGMLKATVVIMGQALLTTLLNLVTDATLTTGSLDSYDHQRLAQLLCDVMATCSHESVRKECVSCFPQYIAVFNPRAKYRLYQGILRTGTHHSGVTGFIIQLIKNDVNATLRDEHINTDTPFIAPQLSTLTKLVFTLPRGEQTDLLKQSDHIMAALNFLRYLLLRDRKTENKTGVWTSLPLVEEEFITPLRSGLRESRSVYSHKLTELREKNGRESHGGHDGPELNIEIPGHSDELPMLSKTEEIRMLTLALHQLDMMHNILVRLEEIIDSSDS